MTVTPQKVKTLVAKEVESLSRFDNWHGITRENLDQFLVDPYPVMVNPDDLETSQREMWVVLEERPSSSGGYMVVFDPDFESWGVAEKLEAGLYVLVISDDKLATALSGM